MAKISIQELSNVLIERNKMGKRDATIFVSAIFDIIQTSLERDRIAKIKGLGTFKIIDVDDRESVNVNTGERMLIEGHGKITFTPDALMKELVNKPFSQFDTVVLNDGVEIAEAPEAPVQEEDADEPYVENYSDDEDEIINEPVSEPVNDTVNSSAIPLVDFVTDSAEERTVRPAAAAAPRKAGTAFEDADHFNPFAKSTPSTDDSYDDIDDEDIPEWVIEPYAEPASKENMGTTVRPSVQAQPLVTPNSGPASAPTSQPRRVFQSDPASVTPSYREPEPVPQPQRTWQPEPEPTPAYQEPEPAPQPRRTWQPEPTPAYQEPEPAPQPQRTWQPEPEPTPAYQEPESAPQPRRSWQPVVEPPIEEEPVNDEIDEEPVSKRKKSGGKTWLFVLLFTIIGLLAGYYFGSQYPLSSFFGKTEKVLPYEDETAAPESPMDLEPVTDVPEPTGEGNNAESDEEELEDVSDVPAPETQPEQKAEIQPEQKTVAPAPAAKPAASAPAAKPAAQAPKTAAPAPAPKPATPAAKPANPAAKSAAASTNKPAVTTNKPAASAVKPASTATKPTATAAKPATTATKPATPAAKPVAPAATPTKPTYRIVGTDKVVRAGEGDNVAKIARRFLGPGMESYVASYNNLSASSKLEVGQEIKIPKLEQKK